MQAHIIGSGIGGLTTAIALQQQGIDCTVYDAARQLAPVGAGILVAPNAMAILDRLDVGDTVRRYGAAIKTLDLTDERGTLISRTPGAFDGAATVAIHRSDLQAILLDALPADAVVSGHRLRTLVEEKDQVIAQFDNYQEAIGDVLIGADGIHSVVRQHVAPQAALRYAGQTCWRGVANIAPGRIQASGLVEAWGQGPRFGYTPINREQIYWFATYPVAAGGRDSDDIKDDLRQLLETFRAPVRRLLLNTPVDQIIRSDLHDLKPLKRWYRGRCVLVGDAAHAMTPNLGQGGAQAIEDAWVLAQSLGAWREPAKAFARYQQQRLRRVHKLVNISWKIGQLTNWRSGFACGVRNTVFRRLPQSMARQQARSVYELPY